METVYFVLGMVTVLLISGVVVIVRISQKVTDFSERMSVLERNVARVETGLNLRIDMETSGIHSLIDSRIDRITNKFKNITN